jgi:hypothetical protein
MNFHVRITPFDVVHSPVYGGISATYSSLRDSEDLPTPQMPHVRSVKRRDRIGTKVLPSAERRMKLTTRTSQMITCAMGSRRTIVKARNAAIFQ